MKAIIIDRPIRTSKVELTTDYSGLFTTVLNVPLMVRNIKKLKAQGINQMVILTNQVVPRELRDGSPWGVQLNYSQELNLTDIENSEHNWILLPGNVLLDLDYSKFETWHKIAESALSRATPRISNWALPSQYFHPSILTSETLRSGCVEKSSLSPLALLNLVNRLHKKPYSVQLVEKVSGLTSNQDFWKAHHTHMADEIDFDALEGFPLENNLWIDLNTRVDKSLSIQGFALIGKNCKINSEVQFKGFVVIGDDVIIDRGAIIENSIIRGNTYIGSDMHLKNAVVNQNRIYRADYDSMLKVEEPWLMGPNQTSSASKWFHRNAGTTDAWAQVAE
jgi:NDP-sugar pyrophosphorylase family protein